MAQTIKIKRSTGSNAPSTLAVGELAYSKGSDTFYIGDPANANTPIPIGGAIKNNAGTPVLATGITEAEIQSLISVDPAGTDNSTNVTLAASVTDILSLSTQEISGVDNAADGIVGWDDSEGKLTFLSQADLRTVVGVDPAGTDNSTDVTLAGSLDYITISGQEITRNAINLGTDVTGSLPNTSVSGLGTMSTQNSGTVSITGGSITGITDLAVADGGTGASTVAGAQANLDLEPGTDILAYDANLQGFVDTFTLPTTDGTGGHFLTTNGSGTLSFAAVSTTDVDVSVANLEARLPQIDTATTIGNGVAITAGGNFIVTGDLTVNGTTTTVNSTTVTVDDPIFTLGGDTAPASDDAKDRGIEFRYFDTTAKLGFFGYDNSADNFVLLTDATNTSEVFSGTKATLNADLSGDVTGNVTGNADTATALSSARTYALTGDVTGTVSNNLSSGFSIATTIASGAVEFGMLDGAAVQTGTEVGATGGTIGDNDTSLLTAAAVINFVEGKNYSTTQGTVTSVSGTGSVNGITLTGSVTDSGDLTLGGTLGSITVSQLDGAAVQTGTEVGAAGGTIGDNDTSLLTAAAVINFVEGKGYGTGDITSVTLQNDSGNSDTSILIGGGNSGIANSGAASFTLTVGTIDGGTYT